MSKKYARSILLAFVGALALNLYAEVAWTKFEGKPSDWEPFENNLLAGQVGIVSKDPSGLGGGVAILTDGAVSGVLKETCGLVGDSKLDYFFDEPITLQKIRIVSSDIPDGRDFDNIKITGVFVKKSNSASWISLAGSDIDWAGNNSRGSMIHATLEDTSGCIANNVVGLRIALGTPILVAQYYSEIEAVGVKEESGLVWTHSECNPADWTRLKNNILTQEFLSKTEMSGLSTYASQVVDTLMNGVPSLVVNEPAALAATVGFTPSGKVAYTFKIPMAIKTLRLTALWHTMAYNGISVNAINVKYPNSDSWISLDAPKVEWFDGTKICQTETLSNSGNGFLARNVIGLQICFGEKKAAIANYYAEIEAVGKEERPGFFMVVR